MVPPFEARRIDRQDGDAGPVYRVGISGVSHHLAGCGSAKHIIAIHTDPDTATVRNARFGIGGDFQKIVPALAAEVRARRSGRR